MKKFLAFTLLPLIFAIVGANLWEYIQRIPSGRWEMIWSNQYLRHNLDTRPVQVLDAEYSNVLVKTESGQIYFCDSYKSSCESTDQLEHQSTFSISRDFARNEIPPFDKEEADIVKIKTSMHETIYYQYYLTSSDGSIWRWGWGDNIYEDFVGVSSLGCFGGIIGVVLAFKLKDRRKI